MSSSEAFQQAVEQASSNLLNYVADQQKDVLVMTMALHSVYIALLHMLKDTDMPTNRLIPLLTALKIGDDEALNKLAKWVGEQLDEMERNGKSAGIG